MNSDIVSLVLNDLPPDSTSLEDVIHSELFSGEPAKALVAAAQLDPWLAAHLADIMEPLALLEPQPDPE